MISKTGEDDIYSGYDDDPSPYSIHDFDEDELFPSDHKTSYGKRSIVGIN